MRTAWRLESSNVRAFYQFIIIFYTSIWCFSCFFLRSLPRKVEEKRKSTWTVWKKSKPASFLFQVGQQHQLLDWEGIQLLMLGLFCAQSVSCHLVVMTEKRPFFWLLLVHVLGCCIHNCVNLQHVPNMLTETLNEARPVCYGFMQLCWPSGQAVSRERWIPSEYILSSSADGNRNRKWVSQDCLGKYAGLRKTACDILTSFSKKEPKPQLVIYIPS